MPLRERLVATFQAAKANGIVIRAIGLTQDEYEELWRETDGRSGQFRMPELRSAPTWMGIRLEERR